VGIAHHHKRKLFPANNSIGLRSTSCPSEWEEKWKSGDSGSPPGISNIKLLSERDRHAHRAFVAGRMIQCLNFQFLQSRMQKGKVNAMREEIHGQ